MKKWFMPLLIAVTLVTTAMFPYHGDAAMSKEEINRQLQEIEKQKRQAEQEAAKLKREMQQLKNEKTSVQNNLKEIKYTKQEEEAQLNYLQGEIDKVSDRMLELDQEMQVINDEIELNHQQLNEAEERVAARDALLKSRLRLMYTNGFVSYMDVLLSSTDFADFLDRYHALTSIVNQDKDILEANEKDRDLIALKKQENELKYQEREIIYSQKEIVMQHLLVREEEKEVIVLSLKEKESALQSEVNELAHKEDEIEHYSEEQEKLLIQLARRQAELEIEKNGEVTAKTGKFAYPLPKTYRTTSNFGYRIDPITGAKGAYHKGMDYGAPGGTDILAAESGKVIVAQWWGGYGNTVIIDHGGGIWTLYAHMKSNSMTVEYGDIVARGQKIGEVGTTGRSTGNHLHFEVRKNETPVDPKGYLN